MPKYKAFVTLILYREAGNPSDFMVDIYDEINAYRDRPDTEFFNVHRVEVLPDE